MPSLSAYSLKTRLEPRELLSIRKDSKLRLIKSPFVENAEDKAFVGAAAPWKGKKGVKGQGASSGEFGDIAPAGVVKGLQNAIDNYSKKCKGVKGTVNTGVRLLPAKVVCQMKLANHTIA